MHDAGAGPACADAGAGGEQLGDVLGEIAAAIAYLDNLGERIRVGTPPGERDATAIPTGTITAVRRSCQRVTRHSGRALAAMSPRRADEVGRVAAQLREVELLRFQARAR